MSEPKLERVTDERIASYINYPNQWDDDETVHGIYADAQAMARELRATRLSAEDVEALTSLVRLWSARQPNHRTRLENEVLAIASRLIGRSAP